MLEVGIGIVILVVLAVVAIGLRTRKEPKRLANEGSIIKLAEVLAACNTELGGHGELIEDILQIRLGELDFLVFLNDDGRFTVSCLNTVRRRRLALDFGLADDPDYQHELPVQPFGQYLCIPTMQVDEFDHLLQEAPIEAIEALLMATSGSLHVTHEEVEFECTLAEPDGAQAAKLVSEVADLVAAIRDIPGLWS